MGFVNSLLDLLGARLVLLGGALVALAGVLLSARGVEEDRLAPGRRAVAQALPIAAVALLATMRGKFDLAVALLFGTSVALLSSVMGFLTLTGPPGNLPSRYRAMWLLLPVAVVLAFVSGFHGEFTWLQPAVLATEGLLLLWVWFEPANTARQAIEHSAEEMPPEQSGGALDGQMLRLMLLGMIVAVGGAYLSQRGGERLAHENDSFPLAVTTGILLSVTMALPLIRGGSKLAERGEAWSPMTSAVAVVLINLCGTLPVAIVIAKLRKSPPANFLPSVWRVDAVFLVLLAILLAPIGAGRLKLDRVFGGMLILAYCAYLMATLWAGVKGQ